MMRAPSKILAIAALLGCLGLVASGAAVIKHTSATTETKKCPSLFPHCEGIDFPWDHRGGSGHSVKKDTIHRAAHVASPAKTSHKAAECRTLDFEGLTDYLSFNPTLDPTSGVTYTGDLAVAVDYLNGGPSPAYGEPSNKTFAAAGLPEGVNFTFAGGCTSVSLSVLNVDDAIVYKAFDADDNLLGVQTLPALQDPQAGCLFSVYCIWEVKSFSFATKIAKLSISASSPTVDFSGTGFDDIICCDSGFTSDTVVVGSGCTGVQVPTSGKRLCLDFDDALGASCNP